MALGSVRTVCGHVSTELRAVTCMVKGPPLRSPTYLLSYGLFYDAAAEIKVNSAPGNQKCAIPLSIPHTNTTQN